MGSFCGKDVRSDFHCNPKGRIVGFGKNNQFTTLLKFHLEAWSCHWWHPKATIKRAQNNKRSIGDVVWVFGSSPFLQVCQESIDSCFER